MKTKLLFLAIMAFALTSRAQHEDFWQTYDLGLSETWLGIADVCVVDDNVVWGMIREGDPDADHAILDYVKTVDNGTTWTTGNIIPGNTTSNTSMIYAISADIAWAAVFDPGNSAQGIYKTTDGGTTWNKQASAAFNHGTASFPNIVYFWDENVGFCQGDSYNGTTHECYTTTDGGATWTEVTGMPTLLSAEEYGTVGYYTVLDDTLWYTTVNGRIFRTYDFGHTFEAFQSDVTDKQIELAFKDQDNGYLSGPGGVFFTTNNGGETWNILFPSTGSAIDTGEMTAYPGTDTFIAVGADFNSTYGSVYSEDGGNNYVTVCEDQHLSIGRSGNNVWSGTYNNADLNGGICKWIGPDFGIGVEELEAFDFRVFPNPFNDVLSMTSNEDISNVEIFNMLGQKVLSQEVNELSTTIDTSNFSTGTYIVKVTIGDITGSLKIIK